MTEMVAVPSSLASRVSVVDHSYPTIRIPQLFCCTLGAATFGTLTAQAVC
jgi:hypothetical protein